MILSFSISNITKTTKVDVDISVVDSLLVPITTQAIEDKDIPLLYYGVEAKDIHDYVTISRNFLGKNKVTTISAGQFGTNSITVKTSNVNITDIANVYFDEIVPLWYQHYSTTDVLLVTTNNPVIGMSLYDYNMQEVDTKYWKYDTATRKLYSNLKNYIDPNTERHIVFYVSTAYQNGESSTELLNPYPVFRNTNYIGAGKRYLVAPAATEISIDIYGFNALASNLYIRENMEDTFNTKVFGTINSSSWRIGVKNDYALINNQVYSVEDSFTTMEFDGNFSLKKLRGHLADVVRPDLIWVDIPGMLITNGNPNQLSTTDAKLDIFVRDYTGKLKAYYTNYDLSNFVYNDYTGSVEAEFAVSSVSADGYIKLFANINADDIVEVNGYISTDYYIDDLNIRAGNNKSYTVYADNNSFKISSSTQITDEPPVGLSFNTTDTYQFTLLNPLEEFTGLVITDNINEPLTPTVWTSDAFGVLTPTGLYGVTGSVTVDVNDIATVTLEYVAAPGHSQLGVNNIFSTYTRKETNYIQLATASVTKNRNFNTLNLLDVRQRGGGINSKYKDTVELVYPESIYYKNINNFSTLDLYLSAGLIINLPGDMLLSKINGIYEEGQIKDKVDSCLRAAIPGAIRYYNTVPILEDILYGVSTGTPAMPYVTLTWRDIKDFSYRIHISYDGNDFSTIMPSPITELVATNEDSFTGTYSYDVYYNLATSTDNLIYVKIEGLYTDNNNTVIEGNFSPVYRIPRIIP